jgi:hypothetical protein
VQVSASLTEEEHTFIIKGVLDPRDNKSALDLQNAIMLGVVDQVHTFALVFINCNVLFVLFLNNVLYINCVVCLCMYVCVCVCVCVCV